MLDAVNRFMREQYDKIFARLGVATKEEVSSLRRRVRDLEGEARPKKAAAPRTPARSTAKRNTAGPAATKTTTTAAKRSAARKTATKKTARKSSRPARRA